jgi:hypothetical protein
MNQPASRFEMPDIETAQRVSSNSDSKLILVVGDEPALLREAMTKQASALGWRAVDLNVTLSRRLIPLTAEERGWEAWDVLDDVVGSHRDGVVLLTSDILFETSLEFRPYETLRRLGRSGPVIAPWFGTVIGTEIFRAQPGHPEYQRVPLDVPFLSAQRIRGGQG